MGGRGRRMDDVPIARFWRPIEYRYVLVLRSSGITRSREVPWPFGSRRQATAEHPVAATQARTTIERRESGPPTF
jgi:hypothetical protein